MRFNWIMDRPSVIFKHSGFIYYYYYFIWWVFCRGFMICFYQVQILFLACVLQCALYNYHWFIYSFVTTECDQVWKVIQERLSMCLMIYERVSTCLWKFLWYCSSVVRAFAHGAMGRRIDHSWLTRWAISHSSQCSTTGVTKVVVCVILSVGWCI